MKEAEIRSRTAHNTYLALVSADAERLAQDHSAFAAIDCPCCGGRSIIEEFQKAGFRYVSCESCATLFVNPRPTFDSLMALYADSPSTRYWVEEFFKPMAEARRARIFRPRAQYVAEHFPDVARGRVGDIGAGFGLFLEELQALWPAANLVAIEPSADMAAILRTKGIPVVEQMLEQVPPSEAGFDLLTAFELFEHLHDPAGFLRHVARLLRPGGVLYLTTLSGFGFDIQVHWASSKSVSPPHHLNFANPASMARLLERTGFDVIEIATPGELDWDIVEGNWQQEGIDPGRLWRTVSRHGGDDAKRRLQGWIRESGFSSHLRAVARRRG
ncbi:MAG: methyltransferase domain-containing protein [Gemmatimonadaceae bacterium]|nr:methyltransferase domain-containing protein [Gemmatimonadaceae bacterium]NUR32994.1 methyltransferase domain-containing protein [Gemmatimonadaceae bacterium]NUS31968.1 methyltransferase domain-containing protein [Gemmatimonadaceae bacterium]NUS46508.1 methyltransferase domain-containing protein [Gemmatimonadaceae bacterium]